MLKYPSIACAHNSQPLIIHCALILCFTVTYLSPISNDAFAFGLLTHSMSIPMLILPSHKSLGLLICHFLDKAITYNYQGEKPRTQSGSGTNFLATIIILSVIFFYKFGNTSILLFAYTRQVIFVSSSA